MRNLKQITIVLVALVAFAIPANAQFKFGPKVGINVNTLHFNKSVVDSKNRTGWTAGVEGEFTVPVVGVGLDASLMYVRRSLEVTENGTAITRNCDYFEIPLSLKWKMNMPVVGAFLKPYIFTGPSFAFLTSKHAVSDAFRLRSVDTSWNVGLGVELVKHLQVSAYYGFGLNKALESAQSIDGKNHCWTVTAAWLF